MRELQDETGGFQTFIPLALHPDNSQMAHIPKPSGLMDLKVMAISRLMLDNFPHIKAYWVMLGLKTAQIALSFGADDLDGTVVHEKIYHEAGAQTPQESTVAEIRRLITEAGRVPVERDTQYRVERQAGSWTTREHIDVSGLAWLPPAATDFRTAASHGTLSAFPGALSNCLDAHVRGPFALTDSVDHSMIRPKPSRREGAMRFMRFDFLPFRPSLAQGGAPAMANPQQGFAAWWPRQSTAPAQSSSLEPTRLTGRKASADLRGLFPGQKYVGCDMRPGPGVDLVEDVTAINLPDESAGTVLCIETFEHVFEVRRGFDEVFRILAGRRVRHHVAAELLNSRLPGRLLADDPKLPEAPAAALLGTAPRAFRVTTLSRIR